MSRDTDVTVEIVEGMPVARYRGEAIATWSKAAATIDEKLDAEAAMYGSTFDREAKRIAMETGVRPVALIPDNRGMGHATQAEADAASARYPTPYGIGSLGGSYVSSNGGFTVQVGAGHNCPVCDGECKTMACEDCGNTRAQGHITEFQRSIANGRVYEQYKNTPYYEALMAEFKPATIAQVFFTNTKRKSRWQRIVSWVKERLP